MDLDGAGERERDAGRNQTAAKTGARGADAVLPPPVTVPVNVPPTRYSRDEVAVVSGATGS